MPGKYGLHVSNHSSGASTGEVCYFCEARKVIYDYDVRRFLVFKEPTFSDERVGNGVDISGSTCWDCILQHVEQLFTIVSRSLFSPGHHADCVALHFAFIDPPESTMKFLQDLFL